MSTRLAEISWPAPELSGALELAARAVGLRPTGRELEGAAARAGGDAAAWLEAGATWLGLEAEPVEVEHAELEGFLRRAQPALLRLAGDRFLMVTGGAGRQLVVVAPDHRRHKVPVAAVRAALAAALEEPLAPEIDRLLDDAGVTARRRPAAARELLARRLAGARVGGCWLLRLPAGAPFGRQLAEDGLPRLAVTAAVAHLVQQLLLVASWWMLGRGVLAGRVDSGWLVAWALLLVSMTPLRGAEQWSLARLTTRAGALLKRRLLAGALRLEPGETRSQGVGQFLGRVLDSEAFETLALSGGHLGLMAAVELVLALPILALGAGGGWMVALLVAWTALAGWLGWRYYGRRRDWTARRLAVTHDLVESLVGHRTRLAQLPPERWHEEEDRVVASYLEVSRRMDAEAARLRSLVPRGWLVVGMLGLAPAFVAGGQTVAPLAIGAGGVLFAYLALWKLTRGLADLSEAAIAWQQVAPLFRAAARPWPLEPPALAGAASRRDPAEPLLEARELAFRYPGRAEPVLTGCELTVADGDRLLLTGASGSGKSTLAALVAGLRTPDSGLLLLDGLDRASLGADGWRRRVAAAPQFHDNHVLSETFLFNLLMGRDWPPSPAAVREAEEVCRAVGLGELLERMPAGLQQMVGESGWQLSHGEQSRLFVARALLQRAELVLFDESFAALDPASLRRAIDTVLERAPTVLVVAHP